MKVTFSSVGFLHSALPSYLFLHCSCQIFSLYCFDLTNVFVIYPCVTNSHKCRGLKQHLFISSQVCGSEVQHNVAGFSVQDEFKTEIEVSAKTEFLSEDSGKRSTSKLVVGIFVICIH